MRSMLFYLAIGAMAGTYFLAAAAHAQNPWPGRGMTGASFSRPAVSPYLNLLDNNESGISNYQRLVRPFVDQREIMFSQTANLQQLQHQYQALEEQSRRPGRPYGQIRETGHMTRFMNYSHYFGGGTANRPTTVR